MPSIPVASIDTVACDVVCFLYNQVLEMLHHSTLRDKNHTYGALRPRLPRGLSVLYTFDVGKVLHHSILQKYHPLGNLEQKATKGIIDSYTFDVGKLLHHSTPLLHLPKALRPSKHQVTQTTSEPGVF
jgi:hypothetical protein